MIASRMFLMVWVALAAPAVGYAQGLPAGEAGARLEDERNSIDVFQRVSPSVVFVVNRTVYRDFFGRQQVAEGAGSGFVWDKSGHVVTNAHVVASGRSFSVTVGDKSYKARLVGVEPKRDIAVLQVLDAKGVAFVPVTLGQSNSLVVGQKTLAIGAPFGLQHTLTTGIVSALNRDLQGFGTVTIPGMIQTDAAINPGNSGGPLLDSRGQVVGMNTMIFSRAGQSAGVGFAVPVNLVRRIVPQLIRYGKAVTPALGITPIDGREHNIDGVIVASVKSGTGAERAGIQGLRQDRYGGEYLGDVIVAVDGTRVRSYDDLYNALDKHSPGDIVTVLLVRNGKEKTVKIQLSAL